jgi:hypothetical protein
LKAVLTVIDRQADRMHETLKEIGVTAVGHRLKLLDAIAALRTDKEDRPKAGPSVACGEGGSDVRDLLLADFRLTRPASTLCPIVDRTAEGGSNFRRQPAR